MEIAPMTNARDETLAESDHITIDYTNYRGERAMRRVIPLKVLFTSNEWHPETQWLLEAFDVEKAVWRTFALKDIHYWLVGDHTPRVAPPAPDELAEWAISRWNAEVANRPLSNVHRRALDTTWRQVIRHGGGDPDVLLGPSHDDLVADSPAPPTPDGPIGERRAGHSKLVYNKATRTIDTVRTGPAPDTAIVFTDEMVIAAMRKIPGCDHDQMVDALQAALSVCGVKVK